MMAVVFTTGYGGIVNPENSWCIDRTRQFVEHVFCRVNSILNIETPTTSNSTLDTEMVDRAAAYVGALTKNGTNHLGNEYVRLHVIEASLPAKVDSMRAFGRRLDFNRQILPDLIVKRAQFDEISKNVAMGHLISIHDNLDVAEPIVENLNKAQPIDDNLDDQALLDQEGNFKSGLLEEDLGLLHLFSGL